MTLNDVSKLSEEEARKTFERIRWPNGVTCPHCGSLEAVELQWKQDKWRPESELKSGKRRPHREGLYKCQGCDGQFSSTMNTILEDSHLPIRTWLMAFAILCSAKKGVSALQLQRQLEIGSYRTAWHLCHRIRHAMKQEPLKGLLAGTVEVDETYVGGKPRKRNKRPGALDPASERPQRTGRGTKKVAVVALVERGGRVRAKPVERVDAAHLQGAIREHVDRSSRLMTDEWKSYVGIGKEFAGGHERVNHSKGEYARGDASTNEVEAYFALLKRGVMDSFHHVSKKHLGRYCDEFSFRWNNRKISDAERTVHAIELSEGCRLMYRDPVERQKEN
jgi:transposase-like protein